MKNVDGSAGSTITPPLAPTHAVSLSPRSRLMLAIAAVFSVAVFGWPLWITPQSSVAGHADVPLLFAALIPLLLTMIVVTVADGGLDAKSVALLGVLTALGAALRPLGTGIAGLEPIFFLFVLGGRVFGPAFGFLLGCTTLLASALITGGVGPWLPYQMLAAAWVGAGAGLLPPLRNRPELAVLIVYGSLAAIGYGLAMNLSFWPFTLGDATTLSYIAGAPVLENLHRFVVFSVVTSMAFDLPRAALLAVTILVVGPGLLRTLRRASHRAAFDVPVRFAAPRETFHDTAATVEPARNGPDQPSFSDGSQQ